MRSRIHDLVRHPDGQIVPQIELGARVGAIKSQAQRSMFYVSAVQSILMWSVGYNTVPLIRSVFSTVTLLGLTIPGQVLWYSTLPIVAAVAMGFDYVAVIGPEKEYNQTQESVRSRSPWYDDLKTGQEELMQELETLSAEEMAELRDTLEEKNE